MNHGDYTERSVNSRGKYLPAQATTIPDISHSLLKGPCVTVRVGSGETAEEFSVHKALIAHHSPFFKAALGGPWKGGREGSLDLPEDEPSTFNLYVCWLYGVFVLRPVSGCCSNPEGVSPTCRQLTAMSNAYKLGNKFLDLDFCNMVIDRICDHGKANKAVPTGPFLEIWNVSARGSKPRNLILDSFRHEGQSSWFEDLTATEYDQELWLEIARALAVGKEEHPNDSRSPWRDDTCPYHHHSNSQKTCYKKIKDMRDETPKTG